jgi:acyl-CoA thioester hydrolase
MNEDSPLSPYEMEIKVRAGDIDLMGHVNNVVYLRWVQDVAIAHWNRIATDREKSDLLWVVKRHEIDYLRAALANETVIARTWVGSASRRSFERYTEILRKEDRKPLAKVRTLWCPVDPSTKRPVAVDNAVFERFSTGGAETSCG